MANFYKTIWPVYYKTQPKFERRKVNGSRLPSLQNVISKTTSDENTKWDIATS